MSTVDRNTPSVTSHDARGLAVRQIAYLRTVAGGTVEPLTTRLRHDVIGRLVEQRDPRLADTPKPNLATVYGLGGQAVKVDSVDSGEQTTLAGPADETLRRWDGRGNRWHSTYDNQLRMLTLEENDQGIVQTNSYADASADTAYNLCGRPIRQVDASCVFECSSFSLHGQPLRDTRTITEGGTFTSSRTFGPLGVVLTRTDAGAHQQRMQYDRAGQLHQVQLRLEPTGPWQTVLEDARYNAAGQIIEQTAGNHVVSTWRYDEANGQLDSMSAGVPGQPLLQHFQYLYDPVGNALRIDDLTFKPVHFANQLIDGHRELTYDSLYRVTSATGHAAVINSADKVSTTHLEKSLALFRLSVELTEALNGTLGPRDLDVTNQALETLSDFLNTQKDMVDEALATLESSSTMHKAEVAGTRHRLGATEIVVKAKMQRVVDLNHRLAQRFNKQQAA